MNDPENLADADLALAAELQAALLPATCPADCPHQEAAARNRMSGKVGGDFYDFIRINEDQVAVVIGDVLGHGVRASLLMARIMGHLRGKPTDRNRPGELIADLNDMLLALGDRIGQVMLCSLFYAVIDLPTGSLFFVNAGHPSPFLSAKASGDITLLGGQSLLLGVQEFKPIEGCHQFHAGQRLVMYTDGLIDANGPTEEYFGEQRLHEMIARTAGLSPQACADAVFAAVDAFRNGAPQQDDETIVIIDRLP
jgi:serine phosphatase RsbU (regulator of sigma subunit)